MHESCAENYEANGLAAEWASSHGWASPEEVEAYKRRILHLEATLLNFGHHWDHCAVVQNRESHPLWVLEEKPDYSYENCDCGVMDVIEGEDYFYIKRLEKENKEYEERLETDLKTT